ncbi:type VI secretion system baseplate subunit TssG [Adhaeribacter aerolatus]|nr:type VI secretion system baseplate subunit TssG [Adhaeribacter aerolatus]
MQPVDDDLRAEVLVASWIENESITPDDIIIKPTGTFRRAVSKDVLTIQEPDTAGEKKTILQISREGLYDMLPEGMFHQPLSKTQKSTEEAIEETERYRQEEKAARQFFLPLEQEFYRQRIWLDSTELKYWLNSAQPENIKMLMRFWKLNPRHFNQRQSLTMLAILPHLHQIVGDLHLTAQGLGVVLGEKVQISTRYNKIQVIEDGLLSSLGSMVLGVDSVIGTSWFDDEPMLQVSVGPVKRNKVSSFLPEGKNTKLLAVLYGFFFQAEVEVETNVEVQAEESGFMLAEFDLSSRLGYSTVI